ncbi:MAG: ATP-dependent 6-phosphofructokinase [Dehalococcoidales bacterium]
MKRIAVLTSGGDAPGMNAAIRAVVRTGIDRGWEVHGVMHGYSGLCDDDFRQLSSRDVGGIIQEGGTRLGSARCAEFKTEQGRQKALDNLRRREIDALVVIGGNGSQKGAHALSQLDYPVLGISSTIDNDIYGCDITIGVDTALDVALMAIDRVKVTAASHRRAFVIEVMGRDSGYLALMAGVAGGADYVVIPEVETDPEQVAAEIRKVAELGKGHAIIIAAEGATCNARGLESYFAEHSARLGFDLRVTIIGYVQRGGTPGAFDRLLATRLGAAATEQLAQGNYNVMVGLNDGHIRPLPLAEVASQKKTLDPSLFDLIRVLAT